MKKAIFSLILGLVLLFVMLFSMDGSGNPSDFALFLGRFHPLLVHLPIGILLIAVLLEGLTRTNRFGNYGKAVLAVLFVGAWCAILAALAGLYLAQGGGYDAWTLDWHRRLGVAIAVLAAAAFVLKGRALQQIQPQTPPQRRGYMALITGLVLAVALTGHLGGELTHGDGYLTRYMPDGLRNLAGLPDKDDLGRLQLDNPEEATTFDALIQPILDERCVACHNPSKPKGGLLLDTSEGLLEGGDDGPAVVAGRSEESELIHRIWLPLAHQDHMPPEGRPQLTVAEAELIRWWIDQGASFEQTLAEAEVTPVVQTILDGYGLDEIRTGIFALDVPPPDSAAVEALQNLGVSVTPLAEEEPFLQVRCTDPTACSGDGLAEALRPLARQVAWLDLGRTQANDSTLAAVSSLEHLTRLHLERTAVTDAGLAHLQGLEYLEYLNLYGTAIGDDGLQHLSGLPALRALYLWQTDVTEAGVQQLQQALPDLDVNLGLTLDPPTTQANDAADS